jgi:hypothetical protein
MMADNTGLTRTGDTWTAAAPGAAANYVMATADRLAAMEEVSENCMLFRDVAFWDGLEGLSPVTMASSQQTATATWNGSNYGIGGLVGAAIFAAGSDTLTLQHDGPAGPVVETVSAPPAPADPASVLGDPAGLATTFHMPTDVDLMFTYVNAPGATGDNGLLCAVDADDLEDDGAGGLQHALVDSDAAAALQAAGLTVTSVNVAYYNVVFSDAFFPDAGRPAPIMAGRMFAVSAADLGV